jgi:hypothetical protein
MRLVDEASPAGGDLIPPAPPILSRDADPALFPGTRRSVGAPAPGPGDGNRELDRPGRLDLLLRFREQLERGARGLVDDYDRLLAQLGTARPPAPEPGGAWAPGGAWEPGGASGLELGGEPQAPLAARPPAATPPHGATPPPAASPAAAADPAPGGAWASAPSGGPARVAPEPRFECRVELDAGPFADIEALSSFERSLARLPHTLGARVRRFDGARAAIDLRLVLTPTLVQEMHETLGVGFSVVDSGPGHVAIVLDR